MAISGSRGKKAVKIRHKKTATTFLLVGSPIIDQEEVEPLYGILRLVLIAQKLLLGATRFT